MRKAGLLSALVVAVAGIGVAGPARADPVDDSYDCTSFATEPADRLAPCTRLIAAAAADPENRGSELADALSERATALGELGDLDGALADLERWSALEPDNPDPLLAAAGLRVRAGQYRRALVVLDEAERVDTEMYRRAAARTTRGMALCAMGDAAGGCAGVMHGAAMWSVR